MFDYCISILPQFVAEFPISWLVAEFPISCLTKMGSYANVDFVVSNI